MTAAPLAAGESPARAGRTEQLSLTQALALAGRLMEEQNPAEAERLCRAVLGHWPEQPDALHFLGVALHAQGEVDEGLALVRRVVDLLPDAASPRNNLGNLLLLSGRDEDAAAAYRDCLARDPDFVEAISNLATLMRRQRRFAESEALCRRAIALRPEFGDAWYNLSEVLIEQGRVADGLLAHSRAVASWPRHSQGRSAVVRALALLGELDQAAALYREWLEEEPDNPVIRHQLAACTAGAEPPPRASDACVEQLFDAFAPNFDKNLAGLGYRAPQLVADALRALWPAPARQFDIADLGCGTGLVGPLLRDRARTLAGCDLSVGMLRQAKQRGCYDRLHKAELVYYLETQPGAFDTVVSADTLCYFGDLQAAADAACGALRGGGLLGFTVEALPDGDDAPHRLQPNGRYAHGRGYLEAVLARAGFELLRLDADWLRMEAGKPVPGWLVVARKPVAEVARG